MYKELLPKHPYCQKVSSMICSTFASCMKRARTSTTFYVRVDRYMDLRLTFGCSRCDVEKAASETNVEAGPIPRFLLLIN